jgi:hypothetical protein
MQDVREAFERAVKALYAWDSIGGDEPTVIVHGSPTLISIVATLAETYKDNLPRVDAIYQRFGGLSGSMYFVGGFGRTAVWRHGTCGDSFTCSVARSDTMNCAVVCGNFISAVTCSAGNAPFTTLFWPRIERWPTRRPEQAVASPRCMVHFCLICRSSMSAGLCRYARSVPICKK